MIAYCSSPASAGRRPARRVVGWAAAVVALGLGSLTGCGAGTASTVTVTDTATATVTVSATASAAAISSATSRPAGSTAAASTAAGSPAAGSTAPASSPPPGSAVPTSAAQQTILTVRLEAYDPATGTLTFIPQDIVETEGDAPAVLSDPVGGAPVTAQVTAQSNVKFLQYGTDIGAAITANDVYCNMVLDGSQVSYLWELYAT